jgi:hypothetical protein
MLVGPVDAAGYEDREDLAVGLGGASLCNAPRYDRCQRCARESAGGEFEREGFA